MKKESNSEKKKMEQFDEKLYQRLERWQQKGVFLILLLAGIFAAIIGIYFCIKDNDYKVLPLLCLLLIVCFISLNSERKRRGEKGRNRRKKTE